MTAQEGKTTEAKTLQEMKEGENFNLYAVLSIGELKQMMKEARKFSKQVYDGKIMNHSNSTFHFELINQEKYRFNNEYQIQLREK